MEFYNNCYIFDSYYDAWDAYKNSICLFENYIGNNKIIKQKLSDNIENCILHLEMQLSKIKKIPIPKKVIYYLTN